MLVELRTKIGKNIVLVDIFLFLFICFFVFIIPPFQKPDEPYHYHQALAYSLGNFSSESVQMIDQTWVSLPQLTLVDIANHQDQAYDWTQVNKNLKEAYGNQVSYQNKINFWNITYLPESLGLYLGRLVFPASPYQALFSFYLGRLMIGLLFFVSVLFLQKRLPKKYQPLFFVFAFLPMLLNQVTALSYDGLLIIATLFAFAALAIIFEQKNLSKKWLGIFAGSLILMQWVKPGYYLLPFAIFLLPFETALKSRRKRFFLFFVFFFLSFLPIFFNFAGLQGYAHESSYIIEGRNTNPGEQLSLLFSQPVIFIKALLITNYHVFGDYFTQGVGILGWLEYDNKFPSWFYYSYLLCIVIVLFFAYHKEKKYYFSFFRFLLLTAILFGSFLLLHLAMYLSWSEVGSLVINGVQGRYFFPLLPFLFFLLHDFILFLQKHLWARKVSLVGVFFLTAFTLLYSTYNRFYNLSNQWQNTDQVLQDLTQKNSWIK